MSLNIRRQLTMFIGDHQSQDIEDIRKKYNPVQSRLIRSHVTLCREHELKNLDQIKENIKSLHLGSIFIHLDRVVRFSDGKGVMIHADEINPGYHHLRQLVLKNIGFEIKFPQPHITLMHPRNSTCTDEIFGEINKISIPKTLFFTEISLIEQEADNEWKIIRTFKI
jgi:2'-5' RNA ligase